MDNGKLSKSERHDLILSEIRTSASIRISQLAKRIGVAGETIRRDLLELGEAGLINRTYGGATISLITSEPAISERGLTMIDERARVARGAVGLVKNGQVVMIDGGSTTYEVARQLAQFTRDLVVITNSLGVASVAGGNPTFRVILCPGAYDHREGSVLGEDTVEYVNGYHADIAIIGSSGVGTTGPNEMISGAVSVKRAMMAQSGAKVLVVTNEKFGRTSLQRVCRLDDLTDIVTDAEPAAEYREAISHAGVKLHVISER